MSLKDGCRGMSREQQRLWEVNLREYVETIIEERDRLYDTRFKAAETAVSAALAAQEKSTNAAFAASEKAVLKAENAQADYNSRSNEFRGQLDDQAKTLMPRNEVSTIVKGLEEKMGNIQDIHDRDNKVIQMDVRSLRESRSEGGGKNATWAIVLVIFLALLQVVLHFIK